LADARNPGASTAPPPPGNRGTDPGLQAKYAAAIQQAILRQWVRPETVPLGQRCRISIRQLPGGEVVDVTVSPSCPYDTPGRQSVERAVLKASPLPYAGFEPVFNRSLELNFEAQERSSCHHLHRPTYSSCSRQ
jgi:colicin import membrane protein